MKLVPKTVSGTALATFLLVTPTMVQASKADVETKGIENIKQQLQRLQEKLEQLEKQQKELGKSQQSAIEQKNVNSKFDVDVSGLLQVQGLAPLQGDGSQGNDTFRLRRGELKLTANVTDRVSGLVLIDIAKTKIDSTNRSEAILQEINLSYLLQRNASNKMYLDVGQTKLPIGYESLTSSSALPFTERSLIFTQGKYGDVRDTGIQLRGNIGNKSSNLEYRIGVFNGLGERQNDLAQRDGKALAGRVLWKTSRGIYFGGSAAKGSDGGKIANLFTGYAQKKWWVSGEYGHGSSDSGVTIKNGSGLNLSAGYFFTPKLEAVVRHDRFDDKSAGRATEATLGLNYYIRSNNAKLQANLVKHDGPRGEGKGYGFDWTELRTGFQVAF